MTRKPAAFASAPAGVKSMSGSGFDKLAKPYRWMEYLTFGAALSHCRQQFLPALRQGSRALVLGDGDGRFTAALLRSFPHLQVDAVDQSAAMLQQLARRADAAGARSRLRIHHADATVFLPNTQVDAVCTHFFLDCLTEPEIEALASALRSRLHPGALWVISEFAVPPGFARWPAALVVRSLYLAFRLLTGLRVHALPDYAAALRENSFVQVSVRTRLFGLLRSELWILR